MEAKYIRPDHPALQLCEEYFHERVLSVLVVGWVAGGAIRDWFALREVKQDIDVWFADEASFNLASCNAKNAGWTETKDTGATVNFRTDRGQWVQLIRKHYFADLPATLDNFDFTVCCGGVHTVDGHSKLLVHPSFFIDLAMRRLAFNAIPFPTSSFKRSAKYIEKGFKFCPDEQSKLLAALQKELATSTVEQAEARYME